MTPQQVRHFTDLRVWQMSHQLFLEVLLDVDSFPPTRGASVVAEQLVRSAGSVGANIAEGFNRSRRKLANSLDIALGEADETENWLYKARDAGYLTQDVTAQRLRAIVDLEKMLGSLRRTILSNTSAAREEPADYLTGAVDQDTPYAIDQCGPAVRPWKSAEDARAPTGPEQRVTRNEPRTTSNE